jgi:dUTP pyrophosphatase
MSDILELTHTIPAFETPVVQFKRLEHLGELELPAYQTPLSAGMDIRAAVPAGVPLRLGPGMRAAVPTGFAMALPPGFEAQIRPRSGLALNFGVTCLNTPGTIDADYRGEVKVLLINHGPETFVIERAERIAQMVIAPIVQPKIEIVDALSSTVRGAGGFGSTGRG